MYVHFTRSAYVYPMSHHLCKISLWTCPWKVRLTRTFIYARVYAHIFCFWYFVQFLISLYRTSNDAIYYSYCKRHSCVGLLYTPCVLSKILNWIAYASFNVQKKKNIGFKKNFCYYIKAWANTQQPVFDDGDVHNAIIMSLFSLILQIMQYFKGLKITEINARLRKIIWNACVPPTDLV